MHKRFLAMAVALIVLLAGASSWAGTATGTATITINYSGACTVNSPTTTMPYTGTSNYAGNFGVQLNCSSGLAWTLTANGGLNAVGQVRRASGSGNYLTYRFFQDSAMTEEIGVTANTVGTGTGTGSAQTQTVYTAVNTADNATAVPGSYTDSVVFTAAF